MPIPVIRRDHLHDQEEFELFSCKVPHDNPDTPDELRPDISFHRKFTNQDLVMPDGNRVKMWLFFDPETGAFFPNEAIRVREGQTFHVLMEPSVGTHTIHEHGIDASPFNDGVGHTSFEVSGSYSYQSRGAHAGTYFYHCHVNTVLHVEMGLYGLLIVDPPTGIGTVRRMNDIVPYDVEGFWVPDEIDPRWHELSHNAGLKCPDGRDAGLNDFNPRYFLITGVPSANTPTDPRVVVKARTGQTVLLRVLNAGYTVQRITIQGLDAEVIGVDGRTLGQRGHSSYSRPFVVPSGQSFELTSAQRWNLLVKPSAPGRYPARVEFKHWVRGDVLGVADTFIEVA